MFAWTVRALKEYVDQRFASIDRHLREHHQEDQETYVTRELWASAHREVVNQGEERAQELGRWRDRVNQELRDRREAEVSAKERLAGQERAESERREREHEEHERGEWRWQPWARALGVGTFAAAIFTAVVYVLVYHPFG